MSFLFVDVLTRFSEDIIRVSKVGFVRLCRSVFFGRRKKWTKGFGARYL